MNKKIKYFRNYRVPYVVVVGDNEVNNSTVAINVRGGKQMKDIPLGKFIELCDRLNKERILELIEDESDI